jgi:hypothetical protein
LTICRKAGKAVFGFDPCISAHCDLLLVTNDISERTLRALKKECPNTEIAEIKLSKEDLAEYFHKEIAVIGICDKGFSTAIKKIVCE